MKDNSQIGNTPIREIDGICFKLEYLNPTGSVKDRGVSYQIKKAIEAGHKKFCISSSGNAAISAAKYIKDAGGNLDIFVAENVNSAKLKVVARSGFVVHKSKRPVSDCVKFASAQKAFNLRASHDPNGWVGYRAISSELAHQVGKVGAVFVPTSSGVLLYGVYRGFSELGLLPQLHAAQTTACDLIAKKFKNDYLKTKSSVADALTAKISPLRNKVVDAIKKSGGYGWVINDLDIKRAWTYLKEHDLLSSYEGACALAAAHRAIKLGLVSRDGKQTVLLTGSYYAGVI